MYKRQIQTPSAELNDALRASAKAADIPLIEGNIHSSDVFYRPVSYTHLRSR